VGPNLWQTLQSIWSHLKLQLSSRSCATNLASEVGLLNIKVRLKQHNSVTEFVAITALNLVTPKAEAKQELLFNKLSTKVGI